MRSGTGWQPGALTGLLTLSVLGAATGWAADDKANAERARYVSTRLMDDARSMLRSPDVTPEIAAVGATLWLQQAMQLDATDPRMLKLLAETARLSGRTEVRRDALKKLIALDKTDLVVQVQYLDLIASASQVMEDRAKVYESAFNQAALDPQIRSEMAVRLVQIADERGDVPTQKKYVAAALKLNDVNIPALKAQVRIANLDPRDVPGQLSALTSLLIATPYQPEAWLQLARICAARNLHDRAADCLATALEQMQLQGIPPSGDDYLELAIEQGAAGRRGEAYSVVNNLARLPDAPLGAVVVAEILAVGEAPGSIVASTRPAKEFFWDKLRTQLKDMVKAGEGEPAVLADAAGVDLTASGELGENTAKWVSDYAALVAPEDKTLSRLRGWLLLRQGKFEEAKTELLKVADSDPVAEIGLAQALLASGQKDDGAKRLQDVWSAHPAGLLALQVTETARRFGVTLQDTNWTRQLREVAARLPQTILSVHRSPREMELIGLNLKKSSVGIGEPIILTVRMTNATDRAVSVGPEGILNTTVGLSAGSRGMGATPLGMYALEDFQRSFRIEPRVFIESTIRVDQGIVGELMERSPVRTFVLTISLATSPRTTASRELVAGLGGQLLSVGDVERTGIPMGSQDEFEKLRNELTTTSGVQQLVRIRVAGAMMASIMTAQNQELYLDNNSLGPMQESAKKKLVDAILPVTKSDDPLVKAILLRRLPSTSLDHKDSESLQDHINALREDPDRLVRMLWIKWAAKLAVRPGELGTATKALLDKRVGEETDPMVKEWLGLVLLQVNGVIEARAK